MSGLALAILTKRAFVLTEFLGGTKVGPILHVVTELYLGTSFFVIAEKPSLFPFSFNILAADSFFELHKECSAEGSCNLHRRR